jgi:hypothetical protein
MICIITEKLVFTFLKIVDDVTEFGTEQSWDIFASTCSVFHI